MKYFKGITSLRKCCMFFAVSSLGFKALPLWIKKHLDDSVSHFSNRYGTL